MGNVGGLRSGTALLLSLMIPCGFLRMPCSQSHAAPPETLGTREWAAKIHAGWVGKVAAGSGALPTEMWSKDQIREKFGVLSAPPQTPASRGPLDDTTLSLLGWHAAQEHGAGFTSADIAREWVDHLTDADLKGGGFGKEFLSVLGRLRNGVRPPVSADPVRAEWITAESAPRFGECWPPAIRPARPTTLREMPRCLPSATASTRPSSWPPWPAN